MRETLKLEIKPIYEKLLTNIDSEKEIRAFCAQWGNKFMDKSNERILFVGKAVNGWVTNSRDIEILFGNGNKRIFNRYDQMEWVQKLKGDKKYSTKKSAFWRVIEKTAQNKLKTKDVFSKIAWSNLYKVSYKKGNPDDKLKKTQKEYCKKILEKEIEIFSPKYVIFLTSKWEKIFLKYLNGGIKPEPFKTLNWSSNKYSSKSYKIREITYITSHHPQGKNEAEHMKALLELMK